MDQSYRAQIYSYISLKVILTLDHKSNVVLNLGSEKGTHFLGQKGHFLSQNLILRAHYFAAPRHYAAH